MNCLNCVSSAGLRVAGNIAINNIDSSNVLDLTTMYKLSLD